MKATGTPQQLAHRLELSERRVYQLLKLLKELEAPVYFDRKGYFLETIDWYDC